MLAVSHPARNARRLLGGERKQIAHLALAKTRQRTRGGGGAEHGPEAVRRMTVLAELIRVERLRQPAADVVTKSNCAKQRCATAPRALGHRQRRRHNAAAGMGQRRRVRVVGLVSMGEHAVGQGGVHRARDELAAHHAGFFGAAERFDVSDRFFPGQKPRAGDHRRDRI